MRASTSRCWLSLAALVAGPVLGAGARAHGSYLASSPRGRSLVALDALTSVWMADDKAGMAEAAEDVDSDWPRDGGKKQSRPKPGSPYEVVRFRCPCAGPESGSTGCAPSGSPSTSGASWIATPAPATLQPLHVVRRLCTEEVRCRPPPFASRLFRPPRLT
jgi:hypothetical protein